MEMSLEIGKNTVSILIQTNKETSMWLPISVEKLNWRSFIVKGELTATPTEYVPGEPTARPESLRQKNENIS